jgi:hypothetical protein
MSTVDPVWKYPKFNDADTVQIRPIMRYEMQADGTQRLITWDPPGENAVEHEMTPDPED